MCSSSGSGTLESVFGVVAAFLSTTAAIPQLVKVRKRHTTKDLSWGTMLLHLFSAVLWAIYGFMISSTILFIECVIVSVIYVLIWSAMLRDYFNPKVLVLSDLPENSKLQKQVA